MPLDTEILIPNGFDSQPEVSSLGFMPFSPLSSCRFHNYIRPPTRRRESHIFMSNIYSVLRYYARWRDAVLLARAGCFCCCCWRCCCAMARFSLRAAAFCQRHAARALRAALRAMFFAFQERAFLPAAPAPAAPRRRYGHARFAAARFAPFAAAAAFTAAGVAAFYGIRLPFHRRAALHGSS